MSHIVEDCKIEVIIVFEGKGGDFVLSHVVGCDLNAFV